MKIVSHETRAQGRVFLEALKKNGSLDIQNWTDWYRYSFKDIKQHGGGRTIRRFGNSFSSLLISCYPEHAWSISKFKNVPQNFWSDKANIKNTMVNISKKLGIKKWEDWYKFSTKDVKRLGGVSLLYKNQNSYSRLVTTTFPEHPWNQFDFKHVKQSYWKDPSNQRSFIKHVEEKLKIDHWTGWYQVQQVDIVQLGGATLINNHYNGSPSALIMSIYPTYPWQIDEFASLPKNYWSNPSNQQRFVDSLEKKLGIAHWKDWYFVTQESAMKEGGRSILARYNGSVAKLIMTIYPQHPWRIFEFRARFTWDSKLVQELLKEVASNLHIKSPDAWRHLSTVHLRSFKGGNSLLKQTKSLHGALQMAFPMDNWDFLSRGKVSKPQCKIVDLLAAHIPRDKMFINQLHPDLVHASGRKAELDVWIPSLNLAIEYHGEHHYHQLWQRCQDPSIRFERDTEKRNLCHENGIDLVEIPYWWNGGEEQLIAAIRRIQPSFLDTIVKFQDLRPLAKGSRLENKQSIEVPLNLAAEYTMVKRTEGWSISEKLDGIRCYWDGFNIYSRGHHQIDLGLPEPTKGLSARIVDGELWYDRGLRFGHGSIHNPVFMAFDILDLNNKKSSVLNHVQEISKYKIS